MDGTGSLALEEEELTLPIAAVNKLIKEAVPKYRVILLFHKENFYLRILDFFENRFSEIKTNYPTFRSTIALLILLV